MFDIFGEFDSAEEINLAAQGLKNEGDNKNIIILAKENGIDQDIAQAFIDGDIAFIADDTSAAVGKLEIEMKGTKNAFLNHIMQELIGYLSTQCMKPEIARRIRSKGKNLTSCLSYTEKKIKDKLQSKNGGIVDATVYGYARDYYMEGLKNEK